MAYGYNGVGIEWTDKKISMFKDLVMGGKGNSEIADILSREFGENITVKAVDTAKHRYQILSQCIEELPDIKIYEANTLPMDDYMISCDDHSPYFSTIYENKLLMIAEFFGIKKHIKVGDLVNQDYASHWTQKEGEERLELDEEIAKSEPLFKALDYFDQIYLVRGNHEDRINRITDSRIQAGHILKLFGQSIYDKFIYTPYDKMFIGDDWMVVHPRSYSQISGSVAVRLAEKFHRNILSAHGHFVSLRYDRSGKYMAMDLGGLFDKRKISYRNLSTTSHPEWTNGFGMLRNGHFWHFHEGTDWNFWERQMMRKLG